MALMRALLLGTIFAWLPVALGSLGAANSETLTNSPIPHAEFSHIPSHIYNKALTDYASRKLDEIKELQPLLSENICKHCFSCMEKALDILKNYSHVFEDLYPGINKVQSRIKKSKRNIDYFNDTDLLVDSALKSVRVTKYKTTDDKVYAIKVNEINNQVLEPSIGKSTCKVYSVKKAFSCESQESNSILMKRKVNKIRAAKQKNTATEKSTPVNSAFKKRKLRVETSHVQESFMPSIEELY